MRTLAILAIGAAVVGVLFAVGPRTPVEPPTPSAIADIEAALPADLSTLAAAIDSAESRVQALTPHTNRRIVWADSARRTSRVVVALHGFSATRQETAPLAEELAQSLGANLYEARLTGHGLPGDSLGDVSAADWMRDAAEAMAVARAIGDSIVLIGTSTGGTLAAWLALDSAVAGRGLHRLVLISPNFGPVSSSARILTLPWARVLLPRLIPTRTWTPANEEQERYWTTRYPLTAVFPMQALVEYVRERDVNGWSTPTLVLHTNDDPVVDPARTIRWVASLPPDVATREVVQPVANEDAHVLVSRIVAPSQVVPVRERIVAFVLAGR